MAHSYFMQRALRLANRGLGRVEPNPMVGTVFVRDGEIIAEGHHHRFGGPHAEADALSKCRKNGINTAGCDVYVTLEPCSHHGKTPPCADALIEAQVGRVFVAMADPFKEVAGRGIEKLRAAGIEVEVGLCEDEARRLNRPYLKRVEKGLPWVIGKWAQTIDGYIATSTGDSKWISNEQSRKIAHQLRGRVDAVMVGVGTVLADDPTLTARDVVVKRKARRVVVDPNFRTPVDCKLVRSVADGGPGVLVAVKKDVLMQAGDKRAGFEAAGITFVELDQVDEAGRVQVEPVLRWLVEQYQATNVLVEGGGMLLGAMIGQELLDQALVFVGPRILGDETGLSAIRGMKRELISQADRVSLEKIKRVGHDVMLEYRFGE